MRKNNRTIRRNTLIAQAAAQRALLRHSLAPLRKPLAMVERGLASSLKMTRLNPAWLVGGIAALFVFRNGPARRWVWNGLVAWRLYRELTSERQRIGKTTDSEPGKARVWD